MLIKEVAFVRSSQFLEGYFQKGFGNSALCTFFYLELELEFVQLGAPVVKQETLGRVDRLSDGGVVLARCSEFLH